MAKPFDATLNALIDLRPADWANSFARLVGIPPGPSVSLDTDLATTLQADKLFRIDGAKPSLLHLELEANPRTGIPRELMRYNTLVDHLHGLPVETVLILLRPKAQASDQTGEYRRVGVNGNLIAEFRYRVERVWERPIDFWLQSGLGLAPLALLTDEASHQLESALDRFQVCMRENKVDETTTKTLLGSSFVLCGLRYNKERVLEMFRSISMLMEESTTYQGILEKGMEKGMEKGRSEGRSEGLVAVLIRLGTKRFGPPTTTLVVELKQITDNERLERLMDRILDAVSWDDLLASD